MLILRFAAVGCRLNMQLDLILNWGRCCSSRCALRVPRCESNSFCQRSTVALRAGKAGGAQRGGGGGAAVTTSQLRLPWLCSTRTSACGACLGNSGVASAPSPKTTSNAKREANSPRECEAVGLPNLYRLLASRLRGRRVSDLRRLNGVLALLRLTVRL